MVLGILLLSSPAWSDPNLIAHWELDDGSGSIASDSAGSNDGTISGATWTTGQINDALSFDGTDDYVVISDAPFDFGSDTDFSICVWIKTSSTSRQKIVDKIKAGYVPYEGYELLMNTNGLARINVDDGPDFVGSATTTIVNDGAWHFLTAVADRDGNLEIYCDGDSEDSVSMSAIGNIDNDIPLAFGRSMNYNDQHFSGKIDDVRIYDRALSSQEVETLYQGGFPPVTYHVDTVDGNDNNGGWSRETAFKTIQKGIDTAEDGDTVLVWPGVYTEELDFIGKQITVKSAAEPAVLRAPGSYAASFYHGEDANSILKNFIIKDSYAAFEFLISFPKIRNVTVVDNQNGAIAADGADPDISNSIFWDNTDIDLFQCQASYSFIQDDVRPLSHWKLDEPNGTIAYDSAGSNDGILNSNPNWTTGQIDGALDFDGTDDYVEVPDDSQLRLLSTDFTIGVWIRPDSVVNHVIISKRNYDINTGSGSNAGWCAYVDNGELAFLMFGVIDDVTTTANLQTNTWQHVVYVFDDTGNTMSVYKNGSYLEDLSLDEILSSDKTVIIGATTISSPGPQTPYDGKIDDVRIYERALTTGEVQQLYQSGLSGYDFGPLFVDANNGDYHLKSEGWRWSELVQQWIYDDVTSPCIDRGNPGSPLGDEPLSIPRDPDNIWGVNLRINMGAYGGTDQASIPPHGWMLLADLNNDGTVDNTDLAGQVDDWLINDSQQPGDLNRDGVINMKDFAKLASEWLQTTY